MPNGTIHKDTDSTTPGAPPRAFHRRSPIQTATPIPARMHKAYARMGKGPRCHTPWGGLGMLSGTIKLAVVLSYVRLLGARAPGAGDQRALATATTAPTRVMRAAAPNPVVTVARWRVSPTELVDRVLVTCRVWATAARSMTAAATARPRCWRDHHQGQDRDNNLPDKQRPPVPQHPLPLVRFDVVSWHVVLVHAMHVALVWVGVWACSSMTATRRSKTGSASVSTCRSCEFKAAMAD